jgi:hypothetical protein
LGETERQSAAEELRTAAKTRRPIAPLSARIPGLDASDAYAIHLANVRAGVAAGVYSSFLRHAYRARERYGVSGAEILMRCRQRKLVGGQEDQILDVASELAAERRPLD